MKRRSSQRSTQFLNNLITTAKEPLQYVQFLTFRINSFSIKVCYETRRPIRPALISGLCSTKRLGVFLLPSGWDSSPLQGYPPALNSPVPIYAPGYLGGERHRYSIVSFPRTRHNVPGKNPHPHHSIRSRAHQLIGRQLFIIYFPRS